MSDYINREKLRQAIKVDVDEHFSGYGMYTELLEMVDECICQVSAEDVVPINHSSFIGENGTCSNCKRSLSEIMDADSCFAIGLNFAEIVACPWCGAKMDL